MDQATEIIDRVRHLVAKRNADQIQDILTHENREMSEKYIDKTMEMRKVGMDALAEEIISQPTSAKSFGGFLIYKS